MKYSFRHIVIFLYLLLSFLFSNSQTSSHLKLLYNWKGDNSPVFSNAKFNDVWGWVDTLKHREYAILGGIDSIYFFDITDAGKEKLVDQKAGRSKNCINRDFDTYKNFCYAVADEGNASLQIFDMKYLPDSVHIIYDEDSLSKNAHTITINNEKLYICKNRRLKTQFAMEVFDLDSAGIPHYSATLSAPVWNGSPAFEYVHDVCVRNDTAFCSCGNDGLFIFSFSGGKFHYISSLTSYLDKSFNHSSSVHNNTLYFTDESAGQGVKCADISNIKLLDVKNIFYSGTNNTAHNPYVKNNFFYMSYYGQGVRIYDISNNFYPVEVAWYVTNTAAGNGLSGCWAVYPFFPSKKIIASDTYTGFFVLDPDSNLGITASDFNDEIKIFPVPANEKIYIQFLFLQRKYFGESDKRIKIRIYNQTGQYISQSVTQHGGWNAETIDVSSFQNGIYFMEIFSDEKIFRKKFVVFH